MFGCFRRESIIDARILYLMFHVIFLHAAFIISSYMIICTLRGQRIEIQTAVFHHYYTLLVPPFEANCHTSQRLVEGWVFGEVALWVFDTKLNFYYIM